MAQQSTGHHLAALTGVRAFAALWVLLFHSWLNAGSPRLVAPLGTAGLDLTPLAEFGWLGLDVFFVLSGFLLARQAALRAGVAGARPASNTFVGWFGEGYGAYLRRRILRVYPAYYACLTGLVVLAATGIYRTVPGKLDLLLHLGMVHNYIERYIVTLNGVFWTLPFEWQFYLVFPLLFIVLRRYGPWTMFAGALACAVLTKLVVLLTNDGYARLLLPLRIDDFAAGMCAGAIVAWRPPGRTLATAAFWVGLAVLFATPWLFAGYTNVGEYVDDLKGWVRPQWIQLGITLFLVGLTGAHHAGVRLFANRATVAVGMISYSIYLWHVPLLELLPTMGLAPVRTTTTAAAWGRILVGVVPAVLVVGTLSYWLFERPFQARAKRAVSTDGPLRRAVFDRIDPLWLLAAWAVAMEAYVVLR